MDTIFSGRSAACAAFLLGAALLQACDGTPALQAQDLEWVGMWSKAQQERPRVVSAVGRMARDGEPGTPLIVHGRVVQPDGKTPASGITVFAYQTDATGVYHMKGAEGWRLRGWAITDTRGEFKLRTVRPAPYPNGTTPAHIHLTIEGPRLPRRWTSEVQFADDALVSESERRKSRAAGGFGSVRAVTNRAGVQHVNFAIRISDEGRF